jgi:hypothetical protein
VTAGELVSRCVKEVCELVSRCVNEVCELVNERKLVTE